MKIIFILLFLTLNASAGRPVYHELSRTELIERSDFIFSGWPSSQKPILGCSHEMGRWWVHQVYRGDRSLQGKVISLANEGYKIVAEAEKNGQKPPSYAAFQFNSGKFDREQSTSFLFTKKNQDGCFELAASGAQIHRFEEAEVEALLASPQDCPKTLRGFEHRASQMPKDCTQDADCKMFSAHPNSCEKPYVWNKSAESKIDTEFKTLQARVRTACSSEWEKQPACSPRVFPIRCRKNRCEEGVSVIAPRAKTKWSRGEMRSSCAPHDAASMLIQVTDGDKKFPIFTINWWGNGKPSLNGGIFTAQGETIKFENGLQSSYCFYSGHCSQVKNFKFKLKWEKGAHDGILDYSFVTDEDESMSGSVPVHYQENSQRVLCG